MIRAETRTCECGQTFQALVNHARFCPECSAARKQIRSRVNGRVRLGIIGRDKAEAMFAAEWKQHLAKIRAWRKKGAHHCRYCGKPTRPNATFCSRCVRDGFDNLYTVTGRTNVWDRKKAQRASVVKAGWRGQAAAGGGVNLDRMYGPHFFDVTKGVAR